MITNRTWPGLPQQMYLLAFAMRGHRLPPDPAGLSQEHLLAEIALRQRAWPHKRWLRPEIGHLVLGTIRSCCEKRGGKCVDAVVCSSCVFALVEVPAMSQYGLCDAIRLLTTKRARRALGWPRSERVFSKKVRIADAGASDALATIRENLQGLSGL